MPTISPIITLLTDFGTADYFVSSVKGRILSFNSQARIIDITHDILPHDIEAAAFTLLATCNTFPPGTIHLAVVDPGVGTSRKPIVVESAQMFFVGPDNGIFSYVCGRRGPERKITHLNNPKYFVRPVSPTFNGRDVFAPVAALLSKGMKPSQLGVRIPEMVELPALEPAISSDGEVVARVIHIDRFGNCVTNISERELSPSMIASGASLQIGKKQIETFKVYFAEDVGNKDEVFAVWGSAGFLELAATNDSAARILKLKRGDAITLRKGNRRKGKG